MWNRSIGHTPARSPGRVKIIRTVRSFGQVFLSVLRHGNVDDFDNQGNLSPKNGEHLLEIIMHGCKLHFETVAFNRVRDRLLFGGLPTLMATCGSFPLYLVSLAAVLLL